MITKTDLQNTLSTYNAVVANELSGLADRVTTLESYHKFVPSNFHFGIRVNRNDSNPDTRVEYLYDNAEYTPVSYDNNNDFDYGSWEPFVETFFTPVMLNTNGTEAYELDRKDQTKKADGTASDIDNVNFNGNAMVRIKKLWYYFHVDSDNGYEYFEISDHQVDNNFCCDCFKSSASTEEDNVYFGMFHRYISNVTDNTEKARSLAYGDIKAIASMSGGNNIATALTQVHNNGARYYSTPYALYFLLAILHVFVTKTTKPKSILGLGKCGTGSSLDLGISGNLNRNDDTAINKGAFYSENRTSYNKHVKTFYIHDFWGVYNQLAEGIINYNQGVVKVRSVPPFDYTNINNNPQATLDCCHAEWVKSFNIDNNIAIASRDSSNASSSTFYCDYANNTNIYLVDSYRTIGVGGRDSKDTSENVYVGPFATWATHTYYTYGLDARLCYI